MKFVKEAFDTNWVAPLGPNVNAFEKELADYVGISHASALSAGTAAIHLALKILGVGEGDVVFVSSLTFSATCNPIVYEKAVPVFIDSEEETWNMDPAALRHAFENIRIQRPLSWFICTERLQSWTRLWRFVRSIMFRLSRTRRSLLAVPIRESIRGTFRKNRYLLL